MQINPDATDSWHACCLIKPRHTTLSCFPEPLPLMHQGSCLKTGLVLTCILLMRGPRQGSTRWWPKGQWRHLFPQHTPCTATAGLNLQPNDQLAPL